MTLSVWKNQSTSEAQRGGGVTSSCQVRIIRLIQHSSFKQTFLNRAKIQMLFYVYNVISFRDWWYEIRNQQYGIWKIGSNYVKLTVSKRENWWIYNKCCYSTLLTIFQWAEQWLNTCLLAIFSILAPNILSHSDIPLTTAATSLQSEEFIAVKYPSKLKRGQRTATVIVLIQQVKFFF